MPLDDARLLPHLRGDRRGGELPASAALDDVLEAEAELVRRQPGRVVVPSPGSSEVCRPSAAGLVRSPARTRSAALMAKERRRR